MAAGEGRCLGRREAVWQGSSPYLPLSSSVAHPPVTPVRSSPLEGRDDLWLTCNPLNMVNMMRCQLWHIIWWRWYDVTFRDFSGGSEVKASACNAGDLGSIPGLGRTPGEGNGNPLQYSCLENPMDRGDWWVARGRKESDMTERLHFHFQDLSQLLFMKEKWHT